MKLWQKIVGVLGLGLLLGYAVYWKLGVYDIEYSNCLLDHRNDFFLLHDRAPIHEACRRRLNPFYQ